MESTMPTTMTSKGRATMPKHIRDAPKLVPGSRIEFAVNSEGKLVLQKLGERAQRKPDRFEKARGKADVKWKTDELMALLRAED
jgi:bifunctional DNA-binding transcriptional regulator/antitoxin component of YhaV-PrlF toxin-antitoxin module